MGLTRRDFFIGAAVLPLSRSVFAQDKFPSHALSIIVPFPPGGSNDNIARLMAPQLYEALGQSVVVENRGGAGGAIGARAAARSNPDGYTMLFHSSTLIVQPSLVNDIGYKFRDFVPVSLLTEAPLVLEISPKLPVKNFAEFLKFARSKNNQIFYGSAGHGSTQHLFGELFNKLAGTHMTHVPFKGNGPATNALLGGEIQVMFDIVPVSKSLGESGKVRVLAVTSKARNPMLPGTPSISEAGIPEFVFTFWQGMSLPKGTPDPIVQVWLEASKSALMNKEVQGKLHAQGYQIISSSPSEFKERMDKEFNLWASVIAEAGIKI